MPTFRLESLASLARQMGFAPRAKRLAQLAAAEDLLLGLEPERAYPLGYVVHAITGYRPKAADVADAELLAGLALQHDVGVLIESLSDAMDLPALACAEPVLTIADVCARFGVTTKTIQRWRRKGLPARRFVFADAKKRVGFRLSCVERFVANQDGSVRRPAALDPLDTEEQAECVRRARRLAKAGQCRREITRRVARRLGRSSLAVLHTLEHHDRLHPHDAVLREAGEPMSAAEGARAVALYESGLPLREIAHLAGCPRAAVYRALTEARAERLTAATVRFHDDPLYHDAAPGAVERQVGELVRQAEQSLPERTDVEQKRIPRGLPAYLADLCRTPLLTPALERALFLAFNFHKYRFADLRSRLDPHLCRRADLAQLERHLWLARRIKNRIVTANLRLVVSVARKHLRPELDLMELVSDGNIVLMRAVEGFDVHRGFRFSTYATLALMKGFARSVPQMRAARVAGARPCVSAIPQRDESIRRLGDRDQLDMLLGCLDEQERHVIAAHYGLGEREDVSLEHLGRLLGMTKHRVRQIERAALGKLRSMVDRSPAT